MSRRDRATNLVEVTMISDRDIWRTARTLIENYGDDAAIHAAQRADALFAEGDLAGQRVWIRVLAAIHEIRRTIPMDGERLN